MNRRVSKGSRIFRTVVFWVLLIAATQASAQTDTDKKQAQALQVAGVHLMDRGDNRGALEKFEAAFRLVPSPKILFNMGKAHHALGHEVEAVTALERFLDEAPYAPKESRDAAERLVQSLHPKLSYLDLVTDEVGSLISIDGHEIGTVPLSRPIVIAPGTHEVRFEKPGMTAEKRSVSPVAGQKLRVFVKLTPTSDATPTVATPPPPVVSTEPVTQSIPAASASSPITNPATRPSEAGGAPTGPAGYPWQLKAAWISAGTGVLFLAGAVTAQVLRASKNSDFNSAMGVVTPANPKGECNVNQPMAGGGPCQGLLDAANSRFTIAVVGYVASGLALTGALVFYLVAPSSASGHEAAASCLPSGEPSGLSCALTLRF
jgi:PEGA domain